MNTKSKIQLIREELEKNNMFKTGIKQIVDEYRVIDNIFKFSNGCVEECQSGYFVSEQEYQNAEDMFENLTCDKAVRIIENQRFVIGTVYKRLKDCPANSEIAYIN